VRSSCEDAKKTLFTILRGKGHPHALLSTHVLIFRLIPEVFWLQLNKLEGLSGSLIEHYFELKSYMRSDEHNVFEFESRR